MTSAPDKRSLSPIEILVLAQLSAAKPPTERALGKTDLELALPDESPARGGEIAVEILTALRGRALVNERARTLTEEGRRALRAVFGLAHVPTWPEVRGTYLPALALGLAPSSAQAHETTRSKDKLAAAVLGEQFGIREAPTLVAVCDALVAEALGLPPGPVTLDQIRTHVLARRVGVEAKGKPKELAARMAAGAVRASRADRASLLQALRRRWAQAAAHPPSGQPRQVPQPPQPPQPPVPRLQQPLQPATPETLLEVVRETIPRVGVDGRFGSEKVFVSAIWRSIERDRRLADLSLDRFKHWLVAANRDGWLVLARADLVGAMDPRLVAESEIKDQGATFHFVLDRRGAAAEGAIHAR